MLDVAPTEEAVKALLDYLVDPMLPLKALGKDPPSLVQQQSVARQMQAVVLLYNYYHRKQHPELCFLDFESFCKLALTLKPALIAYMKLTHQTDSTRSNDLENQLSLTEKAIMDSCNISLSLDELKDVPSGEAWPISKVSVLLVDSGKENCMLLYDSITNGVWSVIEKCLDVSNIDLEIISEGKHANKRKKTSKKMVKDEQLTELGFEQLAFGAVKEATGINQSDLTILEAHVVYSLSKEKTAAYFYIIQCTSNEDIQVPIKDTVESLQGPLFKWISRSWMITSVVEYYNVLPYAMIVSGWYSREVSSNSLHRLNVTTNNKNEENCGENISEIEQVILNGFQNLDVELGNIEVNSSQKLENPCSAEANKDCSSNDRKCNTVNFSGNDIVFTEKSKTLDEEIQVKEQSDKSCDITHPTVKSKMADEDAEETEQPAKARDINIHSPIKQLEICIAANCCGKGTTGTEDSKRAEKEVPQTGKHDILLDISDSSIKMLEEVNSSQILENTSCAEANKDCDSTVGNCNAAKLSDNEKIVTEKSKTLEEEAQETEQGEEAQETEQSDKSCDITHPSVKSKIADEKAGETEELEQSWDIITHTTVKPLEECISANRSSKGTVGMENSKRVEKEVHQTEKHDILLVNYSAIERLEEVSSSQIMESPCYAESNKGCSDNDGNCNTAKFSGNEIVTEKSKTVDEEAEGIEQSDKSCYINHPTVRSKTADEEAGETEELDKYWDFITHSTVKQLENSTGADCSGKGTIGTDNSKRAEKELKQTEKQDISLDINIKKLQNCVDIDCIGEKTIVIGSKSVENKVEDTEKSDTCEITYSTVKELRYSVSSNSSCKENIGADNSKGVKKVVEDPEKSNKSCNTLNSTIKELSDDSEASKQGLSSELQISCFSLRKRQKMDDGEVTMSFDKNGDINKNAEVPMHVYHHQKRKISMESDPYASVGGVIHVEMAGAPKSNASKIRKGKVSGNGSDWIVPYNLNGTQVADSSPVCFESNAQSVETLQSTVAAKNLAMAHTALGFLFSKRAKLCHQRRLIQDEVALCDRNIQKILEGNGDALASKFDPIMDSCHPFVKDKTQDNSFQYGEGHHLNQFTTGKRISDAIFKLQSPYQDLNDICCENNWIAKYSLAAPDGGFLAKVMVKGMDFSCSCSSDSLSTLEEAKNSAAAKMIAELRAMAGHT